MDAPPSARAAAAVTAAAPPPRADPPPAYAMDGSVRVTAPDSSWNTTSSTRARLARWSDVKASDALHTHHWTKSMLIGLGVVIVLVAAVAAAVALTYSQTQRKGGAAPSTCSCPNGLMCASTSASGTVAERSSNTSPSAGDSLQPGMSCVECNADSDCAQGKCVNHSCKLQCTTAADCPKGFSTCTSAGVCDQCASNSDCPSNAPVCNDAGTCTACSFDGQCSGADVCRAGACVSACRSQHQGDGSRTCPTGTVCIPSKEVCGDCVTDDDCSPSAFPGRPYCNTATHTCSQCDATHPCPSGYTCSPGGQAGSGNYCVQYLCPTPTPSTQPFAVLRGFVQGDDPNDDQSDCLTSAYQCLTTVKCDGPTSTSRCVTWLPCTTGAGIAGTGPCGLRLEQAWTLGSNNVLEQVLPALPNVTVGTQPPGTTHTTWTMAAAEKGNVEMQSTSTAASSARLQIYTSTPVSSTRRGFFIWNGETDGSKQAYVRTGTSGDDLSGRLLQWTPFSQAGEPTAEAIGEAMRAWYAGTSSACGTQLQEGQLTPPDAYNPVSPIHLWQPPTQQEYIERRVAGNLFTSYPAVDGYQQYVHSAPLSAAEPLSSTRPFQSRAVPTAAPTSMLFPSG